MSQRIKAIFHGGVFEPSQSVKLRDGAEVDVILPSEENLPDKNHARASVWFDANETPLFTTDFVVDETLTLLKIRGEVDCAIEMGRAFFNGSLAEIHHISREEIYAAWETFEKFRDKDWSFTDCTSWTVMRKLGINQASAFDRHFTQFGFVSVFP
ncbi:DUF104 domain-containing protein [Candidatus Sumerlaeota bacterium]|nr:DUF104 domain-containing protein [Candidatus Sumerlaeota bacterium]